MVTSLTGSWFNSQQRHPPSFQYPFKNQKIPYLPTTLHFDSKFDQISQIRLFFTHNLDQQKTWIQGSSHITTAKHFFCLFATIFGGSCWPNVRMQVFGSSALLKPEAAPMFCFTASEENDCDCILFLTKLDRRSILVVSVLKRREPTLKPQDGADVVSSPLLGMLTLPWRVRLHR